MARYPTFEEHKSDPIKGIKRCDELLRKQPQDVSLLTTKLSLLAITDDQDKVNETISKLVSTQTRDLNELAVIDEAVSECLRDATYPLPLTSGPEVAKLWENAAKATTNVNARLDYHSLRFSRAIYDNRIQDAQSALIQLKVLQPKNRVFYMAHAIYTQLLSTSKEDLQSRLALSLARKAVSEGFDGDKELDCRVPGQIFALQGAKADVDGIAGKRFAESKQMFDALKSVTVSNGDVAQDSTVTDASNAAAGTSQWLDDMIDQAKVQFTSILTSPDKTKLQSFAADIVRSYRKATEAMNRARYRNIHDLMFLAISALIKTWDLTSDHTPLLQAAALAESLLYDNPQIHEAKVILVHLYTRLDLGALALKHSLSLAVKEVQYDTIGHIFLTRISDVLPVKPANAKGKHNDPYDILATALAMYDRCEANLARAEAGVLESGQTGMIMELHDLRENLRQSVSRRIFALEQLRVARVDGQPSVLHIKPRLLAQWLDVRDNRDFKATFDFGFDVETALHGMPDTKEWLLCRLAEEIVRSLASGAPPPIRDPEQLLEKLDDLAAKRKNGMLSSLYEAEDSALQISYVLLRQLLKGTTPEDLALLTQKLDNLPLLRSQGTSQAFPLRLRDYHVLLSICDTLLLCTNVKRASLSDSAKLKELGMKADRLAKKMRKDAQDVVASIEKMDLRQALDLESETVDITDSQTWSYRVDRPREQWDALSSAFEITQSVAHPALKAVYDIEIVLPDEGLKRALWLKQALMCIQTTGQRRTMPFTRGDADLLHKAAYASFEDRKHFYARPSAWRSDPKLSAVAYDASGDFTLVILRDSYSDRVVETFKGYSDHRTLSAVCARCSRHGVAGELMYYIENIPEVYPDKLDVAAVKALPDQLDDTERWKQLEHSLSEGRPRLCSSLKTGKQYSRSTAATSTRR
ncbi:hypothetical protein B0A48_05762 [Cryoendolithus antarcticus]|uniref:Uncharacterized protein n=1 Tax=Cryoendolithus antarcticus TaxID=1507870 RepID=A0A1V8TCE5_9PEZI|nr:hypothetical protein B0A48_05762 [Cryoendolithus antarcticus]